MNKIKINNEIVVNKNETLLNVIKKINDSAYYFQIVVENDKLLGTISDGDIRRALLKGVKLHHSIKKCMNKKPIYGKLSNSVQFKLLISKIPSIRKFLPVVDNNNKLKFIIIDDNIISNKIALVMAGGFGTRLGNKTKDTPKPLLKIANKSMLELIIEKLEKCDYKTIYISTHYLHNKIKAFIKKRKSLSKIRIIHEKVPLGTAGAIGKLIKNDFDFLTVVNGDVVSDIDFSSLYNFHIESKNDITITVAKYSYQIPFGVISFDKEKKFKNLIEKPVNSSFILSGIYCLNKEICLLVDKKIDMTELINKASALKKNIGVFPIYEYWRDVGSLSDFSMANKERN